MKTNCIKNGKAYYRITKVIGHKDGKPIRKEFYGKGIKDAEKKALEYMNKTIKTEPFIFMLKTWLFTIKRIAVKPATFVHYEGTYRNYLQKCPFKLYQIADIRKLDIQNYYNSLLEEGKSAEKIKSIHKLLHSFFEYCIDEELINKNPSNKISIPKTNQDKKLDIFNKEELNYIMDNLKGLKYEPIICTAIYTGMREGEILALKWSNVHLDKGYIEVKESVKRVAVFDKDGNKKMQTITSEPKTANSKRIIYIPNKLISILSKMDHQQELVFGEVTHKQLYNFWTRLLKRLGIKHRKFHALRHTYASTLLLNGADLKSVQELMGHYDIRITQVYLHTLPEKQKEIVSIWDK